MADYEAFVRGTLPNGRPWSIGRMITSNQTAQTLLTTWQNAWESAWNLATTGLATVYDPATVITGFEVGTLDAQLRKVAKLTADVNLIGSGTGDPLPASVSVVWTWHSAVTQRYGRGFNRLPAVDEASSTGLVLTATAGANVNAAAQSIRQAIVADGSTFFVAPDHATVGGQPAFAKTVLTDVRVRQQLGTERIREAKVPKTYA